MFATIYYFFTSLPHFSGAGAKEFTYGSYLLYPGAFLFFIFGLIWILSIFSKKIKESNPIRFALWIGLKLGVLGILIGVMFYAIGGIKLLISKF